MAKALSQPADTKQICIAYGCGCAKSIRCDACGGKTDTAATARKAITARHGRGTRVRDGYVCPECLHVFVQEGYKHLQSKKARTCPKPSKPCGNPPSKKKPQRPSATGSSKPAKRSPS